MLKKLSPFHSSSSSDLPAQLHTLHSARSSQSLDLPRSLPNTPGLQSPHTQNGYFPAQSPAPVEENLSRNQLEKSLRCLEVLLAALNEFRGLAVGLARAQKKISKAAKDLSSAMKESMPEKDVVVNALSSSSCLFDVLSEVDTKFSKLVHKEYETANEACEKAFTKIAKEERQHDEAISSIDAKLKRASANYEKRMRATTNGASPAQLMAVEHEKHIHLLSTLSNDMSRMKQSHSIQMRSRRDQVVKEVAKASVHLAEGEWKRTCEAARKSGSEIGKVMAWSSLVCADTSIPPEMPSSLQDYDIPSSPQSRQTSNSYPQPSLDHLVRSEAASGSSSRPLPTPGLYSPPLQSAPLPRPDLKQYDSVRSDAKQYESVGRPDPKHYDSVRSIEPKQYDSVKTIRPTTASRYQAKTTAPPDAPPLAHPSPKRSSQIIVRAFEDSTQDEDAANDQLSEKEHSPFPSEASSDTRNTSLDAPVTAGTRYSSLPKEGEAKKEAVVLPKGFVLDDEEGVRVPKKERVERSMSVDSTASSRSFVEKMKQKYMEEKREKRKAPESVPSESRRTSTSSHVADLASRFSPDQFRRSEDQQRQTRPSFSQAQSSTRTSTTLSDLERLSKSTTRSDEPHPDICGCHVCSMNKYSPPRSSATQSTARMKADRRVSLPTWLSNGSSR